MPHNIGLLHVSIPYGMPQSQLYSSGTADLKPHILSNAIDWVYAAFFYSDYTQQKWHLPEEILFSHFRTNLNDTFATELAQEDEGYESGSESLNVPTPLSRAPRIYHVSMVEDLSFNSVNFGQSPTTAGQHAESSPCRYRGCSITHCQMVFTSLDDESPVRCSKECSQHFQCQWLKSQLQGGRCFIFSKPQPVSSHHTHTHCKPHSSQMLGIMIPLSLRKPSQQCH